jgi:DNA-binding transcriptional LysR family regulator
MDLDLRDLEVMAAVAREGSFGKAAASLRVTQPAVSERIRHLERVIGRSVFDRSSRGAVLTAAGEGLLPYAQRCLALAEEALDSARNAGGVPRFVIAVHSTFAPRIVPVALGALATLPRRVAVRDAHSHEVQALVLDGAADVGFAIPGPAPRGLRRVRLRPDPVVCVASPDHPIARSRSVSTRAFADTLVAVNRWGEGADDFVGRLGNAGVAAWRIRECGDAATAVALARDHEHLAFVTRSTVAHEIDDGGLRRLSVAGLSRWAVQLEFLSRARNRADEAIRAVELAVATA